MFHPIRRYEPSRSSGGICIKCKNSHERFKTLKEKEQHNRSCFKCEYCWNLFSSKRQLKQPIHRKLEEDEENCAKEISKKRKEHNKININIKL